MSDTIESLRAELAAAHKLIDEHSAIFARAKRVLRIHDGKEAANAAVEVLGPMALPAPTPETMPLRPRDDEGVVVFVARLLRERAEQANLHIQEMQALRAELERWKQRHASAETAAHEAEAEVQRLNDADRLLREAHMATVRERDALAKEVERLRAMVPSFAATPATGANVVGGTVASIRREMCRLTNCGGDVEMRSEDGRHFIGHCDSCGAHHAYTVYSSTTPGPGEGGPW